MNHLKNKNFQVGGSAGGCFRPLKPKSAKAPKIFFWPMNVAPVWKFAITGNNSENAHKKNFGPIRRSTGPLGVLDRRKTRPYVSRDRNIGSAQNFQNLFFLNYFRWWQTFRPVRHSVRAWESLKIRGFPGKKWVRCRVLWECRIGLKVCHHRK